LKKFKNYTLKSYLEILEKKEPVPGGGSACAYSAALAAGLISMVAVYSKNKGKSKTVELRIEKISEQSKGISHRLLELVDLDAKAYLNVVKAKNKSAGEKKKALMEAQKVPAEICQLSYRAVNLISYLVKNGNKYLISDLEVAAELLFSAHRSASILYQANG